MAGPYSTDLRERVLAAVEAGETPEAAARRFAVGRSTAYRWVTAAREEGRRAAKRMRGGPAPRISALAASTVAGGSAALAILEAA
ncbi:MAG: helix-turn-helix domain-containing protein [Acetobacteraceae bacterium]|nr:helix-turn-helix domain-containing protein [Acetobacteraceae bacterium]